MAIDSITRSSLYYFIGKSFQTLNPATEYLPNWHIMQIARALERCVAGDVRRLIINMPPRYLKSICASVAFPAWLLGNDPARRVIVASHNQNLSLKFSLDTRRVMTSRWYREIFPHVRFADDQNEKGKFMTTESGFRLATSVGGGITGEGGNFLIVDDPQVPASALNKNARAEVVEWFDQTFSTRLDDKKNGIMIVVMQRLHEDDLSGVLLARGGWEHLSFPVIDERGRLLHAAREGVEEVARLKAELGEYVFASQYLQAPYVLSGGIIKREWVKFFDVMPSLSEGAIYQSWDTAVKAGESSDYSVCLTVLENASGVFVVDVLREKLVYPELKRKVLMMAEVWKPDAILVEDKASGQSLIQDLRLECALPVIAQMPVGDKVTRLARVSPMIEAGKVFFGRNMQLLEAELVSFPGGKNDDMVDALSQVLSWIKGKNSGPVMNIRRI